MPLLFAPLVVTVPLVMLTPPFGPSAASAPGGAIEAGPTAAAFCWPKMPVEPEPVVATAFEVTVTAPVPIAEIPTELVPAVWTVPVLLTVALVAPLAKMPLELTAPDVVTLPLVTETAPPLEAA